MNETALSQEVKILWEWAFDWIAPTRFAWVDSCASIQSSQFPGDIVCMNIIPKNDTFGSVCNTNTTPICKSSLIKQMQNCPGDKVLLLLQDLFCLPI